MKPYSQQSLPLILSGLQTILDLYITSCILSVTALQTMQAANLFICDTHRIPCIRLLPPLTQPKAVSAGEVKEDTWACLYNEHLTSKPHDHMLLKVVAIMMMQYDR